MSVFELMNHAASIENAERWNQLQDKYVFCLDLLNLSAHNPRSDAIVEDLESMFEAILERNGIVTTHNSGFLGGQDLQNNSTGGVDKIS